MGQHGLMAGKRGLIMGLANDKSIAWGIAKALCRRTAPNWPFPIRARRCKKRVDPAGRRQLGSTHIVLPCDVGDEASIDALFAPWERMGAARLSGPRHRVFRQGRAARPLCRYQPRQFPA
jgi:enoyl-[acyl-carrier-protein] reductase (NADH)